MPPAVASHPWPPSRRRLETLLRSSLSLPMVALPPEGGFWAEPEQEHSEQQGQELEEDEQETCRTYRAHFLQSEHFNFCGLDDSLGPVVLSVRYYTGQEEREHTNQSRVILRLTSGTQHSALPPSTCSPLQLARSLCPALSLPRLQPVLCPQAAQAITYFDE